MTNQDIWSQLVKRYGWTSKDDVVKLKAGGIKALIDQAWDEGYKTRSEIQESLDKNKDPSNLNIFSDIFK